MLKLKQTSKKINWAKRKDPNKKTTNSLFARFQAIGRAFMLPIAVLPLAGLLLGLGSAFTNDQLVFENQSFATLGHYTFLGAMFDAFKSIGQAVFDNLPLLFAISIVFGLYNGNKAVGALVGLGGFISFNLGLSVLMAISGQNPTTTSELWLLAHNYSLPDATAMSSRFTYVLGIYTYNMGVMGGIISGILSLLVLNSCQRFNFHQPVLKRLYAEELTAFIISIVILVFSGALMYYVWQILFVILQALSSATASTGLFGSFLFGFTERSLVPFGVHHAFYLPFWQTQLGGDMSINGDPASGAQNIWFAQLAAGVPGRWEITQGARFWEGRFALDLFGIPAIGIAILTSLPPEARRKYGPLYISAIITSLLTGVTEPLEFTFLFASPLLFWGIHAPLTGLAHLLMHVANASIGQVFSGGIIEFILFGIIPGNEHTNWVSFFWVGPVMGILWFVCFKTYLTWRSPQVIGMPDNYKIQSKSLTFLKQKLFPKRTLNGGKHV